MRWLVVAALGVGCTAQPDDHEITPGPTCTGALGEVLVAKPAPAVPQLALAIRAAGPVRSIERSPAQILPPMQVLPPVPVLAGMHVGSITDVAVAEDDSAAISLDSTNGLRLWASLDGRREPIVVAAVGQTRKISIERAPDELMIARLDDTGTLELIRRDSTGAPVATFSVASERPFVDVRAVVSGALALRDDGALVGLNLIGETMGTILPDPGARIVALLYRNHRALALLSSVSGLVGRWVEENPLTWGATTPRLAIDPTGTAMSADHARIAGTDSRHTKVSILDLATGRLLARPVDVGADDNQGAFHRAGVVGFLDDGTLALQHDGTPAWWHDKAHGLVDGNLVFVPTVVTGHHVIGANGTQLAIASPLETRFLGYRLGNPSHFLPTPGGLLIGGHHALIRVDHQFADQVTYQLDPNYQEYLPIDPHHVVATHASGQIYSLDLDDPDAAKLIGTGYAGAASYEPSSHLLAIDQGANVLFTRFDPRTGTFDDPTLLEGSQENGNGSQTIELLDPTVSNGRVALVVFRTFQFEGQQRSITVRVVRAARRGVPPVVSSPRVLTEAEMRLFDSGDRSMLGLSTSVRRKSPDGKYVAELGHARITLRRATGEQLWMLPAARIDQLAWTSKGELLVFGGGVGVMDVTTGAFTDRRCGWELGLWADPSNDNGAAAEFCQLR